MKKTLHIIPHSHWDREWYLPFEKHRVRLVELFDTLIDVMEQNPDYTYYHMDGQYIVIDDYLEIKPHMRERLMKLIRDGRIHVGPWYVLQDEYLTSGEANVRNMLYGLRLCREIGAEPVETGYFPDSFGNISQAPQIVRGFGFDNAVFGRGINDVGSDNQIIKQNGITTSELIWRGADGSEVIAVLFANWYHNAMELPAEETSLRDRLAGIVASTSRFALTDHLLGMNGCDHQPVQTDLHEAIALANRVQDEVVVKQSNFKDYIAAIRPYKDTFPVYEGEMNGQLATGSFPLVSTSSSHVDIKQKNHDTQHLLERVAEPVSLLAMLNGGEYKQELLFYAWKKLMQNHPHDSICSCSCDEIYEEMKTRFAKAAACGEELRDGALDYLVAAIDTADTDGDHTIVVLSLEPNHSVLTVKANVDLDRADDTAAIAVFDETGREVPAKFTYIPNQFTYTLPKDRFRQPRYVNRFEVEMQVESHGVGYRTFTVRKQMPAVSTAVRYTESTMENEFLAVQFHANGTVDVTDKRSGHTYAGQNLFEDTRDVGDLYNYWQAKGDEAVTTADAKAEITLHEVTPWSVTFKAAIPMAIDADVTTYVTLSDKVARVDFRTVVVNRMENHRLRALFPTDIDTRYSFADGQFDVLRRSIQPSEFWQNPCNSHRCQAFAGLESETAAPALMVANRGLHEYEVLRDGHNTLAVTLLRAVGQIGDWGVFPTPLGQKKGTWTLEYSLIPYAGGGLAEAYREGYTFSYPAVLAIGTPKHDGTLPAAADYVRFDNEHVRMTAFKKAEDRDTAILRLFNTTAETAALTVELSPVFRGARLTNLNEVGEEELALWDGKLLLDIPAKKIVTVELY
ncbi:MAG: alpha-mannosidase [Clostridia bacterium]|nr:alpha-mannosidase [Clostridia bacterium]